MNPYAISYAVDSKDIRFALLDVFHTQDLARFKRFEHVNREQIEEIVTRAERIAVEVLAPLNEVGDRNPPQYREGKVTLAAPFYGAYKKFCAEGWLPLVLKRESGGRGFPESLVAVIKEMHTGACGGFYAYPGLTAGALKLVDSFGSDEVKRMFREKMAQGIYTGTMCLTEPDSGSYLADITTRAKRTGDTFSIKGMKIFIGAGEHDLSENIVHCVLARVEGAPAGYKGISLFAVPKTRMNPDGSLGVPNDVYCPRIESKMGHEGATTASLRFGDRDACQGWLLGSENNGLAHMFVMMNEARLGTAVHAVGQAAAAYQMALAFARSRVQGLSFRRKKGDRPDQVPIIQHPDVRRNLLFMKAIVEGLRGLNVQTGLYIDLSKVLEGAKEREYYDDLVEILTPICKSYAADLGFKVAETAVQTMGGRGFIKDYPVEQYLRDLKPTSLYEGANGIQAITHQGRNLNLKGGQLFRNLVGEVEGFVRENLGHPSLGSGVAALGRAKEVMVEAAGSFPAKRAEDVGLPLTVAKPLLDLTGHILCTWVLLKSAVVADIALKRGTLSDKDREFYRGKTFTAQFAVANLLPQVDALAKTISLWDRSILDIPEGGF